MASLLRFLSKTITPNTAYLLPWIAMAGYMAGSHSKGQSIWDVIDPHHPHERSPYDDGVLDGYLYRGYLQKQGGG